VRFNGITHYSFDNLQKAIDLIDSVELSIKDYSITINPVSQPDVGETIIRARTIDEAKEVMIEVTRGR